MRQLTRLLRHLVPHSWQLVAGSALLAVDGLMWAFRLMLLRPIFDRVLNPAASSGNIQLFTIPGTNHVVYLQAFVPSHFHNPWNVVAYALVLSSVVKGICDYAGTYLVNYAGFGMITSLRNGLYESILQRSAAFFQKYSTGTLISTIVNDIEKIQFAMSSVLAEFLEQFFTFFFTAIAVIVMGGNLAWILLLFVPFIIYSARRIGVRVRHTTRTGQDQLADVQNILQETITGNRIVKAFSMEAWEFARFRKAAQRLFRANMRSVAAAAISSPLMDFLGALAIALLLYFGRELVVRGGMSLGVFGAFIGLVFSLYNPVRKFAMFYNSFQQALGASTEIFKFMDVDDEVREKTNAIALPPFSKKIVFDDVNFCYQSETGLREVLHHISLDVKPGEILALVGSSGAGKSTLVSLVPRFFDVSSGRILIDGHDVRDVTVGSLRSQISVVTQETVLFNDTLRNNIAYGQPGVSKKEVEAAARAALAHDFITALPQGYETVIGEKGVRLSGGERQRIAIARALLKNSPILILDEATSALDSESEALVQSALHNLMTGRTVIVIAHRLSTVRRADRIAVIENGMIADVGTHEQLMQKLGTYRRLYDLQFIDIDLPRPAAKAMETF
jgi:ATP-binding cassette, subfamily B, bacterial MsbA